MKARDEAIIVQRLLNSAGDGGAYYAAHWCTDTNIYRLLQVIAGELASGSAELAQTYADIFLSTCRSSLLYQNFGTYFGVQRAFEQDIDADTYSATSGSWVGYRKQLRFLWDAALAGGTYFAAQRVGHAFYGISPSITAYRDVSRWRLSADSGSVTTATTTSIQDTSKAWRPAFWTDALFQVSVSGAVQAVRVLDNEANTIIMSTAPSVSPGASYKLTFSKLGFTKIYSRAAKAFGATITFWPQPNSPDSRQVQFREVLEDCQPAGSLLRWSSGAVYVAETTAAQFSGWQSGSSVFTVMSDGSIVNNAATITV